MVICSRLFFRFSSGLIKDFQQGGVDRFAQQDRRIRQLNHPYIKTYSEYILNTYTNRHDIYVKKTESGDEYRRNRINASWSKYSIFIAPVIDPQLVQDDLLQRDIQQMRLIPFLKECIYAKPRKPQHEIPVAALKFVGIMFLAMLPHMIMGKPNYNQQSKALTKFSREYSASHDTKSTFSKLQIYDRLFQEHQTKLHSILNNKDSSHTSSP